MMDIRGIEITNQLRSAIRAKLLELGIRYDEELPDYILVMVVNKKSRQQMHEDLNLFLEDSTTVFVDWLHDQVLKKLQKVTVAKRKTVREFVPTVVVKQEEEKKKRKLDISSLEDQSSLQPSTTITDEKSTDVLEPPKNEEIIKEPEEPLPKTPPMVEQNDSPNQFKKLKSAVNKPKITSVVSIKSRLGIPSNRKKFEVYRLDNDKYYSKRTRNEPIKPNRNSGPEEDISKKNREIESKSRKSKTQEKSTIKERLGIGVNKFSKPSRNEESDSRNLTAIKTRLGPAKRNFIPIRMDNQKDVVASIRSRVIAVNKPTPSALDESQEDIDMEEVKLPSKVIVTPRPLKPLQPVQKRATQSLLLRAVAEANQSVVMQKNPEPSLMDKKPTLKKRLKPVVIPREIGNNLSVHLNANKRLVMEKIQVELDTKDSDIKPYEPQPVTKEHMGVMMSLFQRGSDNQKFLVTLNGYNNNLMKDNKTSDDEEGLEMEINEDDEIALSTTQNEIIGSLQNDTQILEDDLRTKTNENIENCNVENVAKKRRKLSPIVFSKGEDSSNTNEKMEKSSTIDLVPNSEKLREKCRYWPNCTLGIKCVYLHPAVMCSTFPRCKYGDKCAYKHPKCKFGLSCTKLGCVFSHNPQECKYHPFCTKPNCPYSHPPPPSPPPPSVPSLSTQSGEGSNQRAKFTWRRQD